MANPAKLNGVSINYSDKIRFLTVGALTNRSLIQKNVRENKSISIALINMCIPETFIIIFLSEFYCIQLATLKWMANNVNNFTNNFI